MTYKAELDAAVAANERLAARVAEMESTISQSTQSLADVTSEIDSTRMRLEERTAQLDEALAEITTLRELVNASEAKIADFESAVARAAQDALAQTGHDPLTVDPNSEPSREDSTFDQMMNELARLQKSDPAAATRYFRDHKAALMAAKR
jgi:chromosome segregation ATPase